MAFQVSPGVLVQEKDLTRIIPAVSTSIGAFAGSFNQGPVDEIISISSEQELVDTFGKPDSSNFEYFFSAANFLQYSNALRVVRATQTSQLNATSNGSGLLVKNTQDYEDNYASGQGFDLILAGKETIDYNGSQVAGMIAAIMDLPYISNAISLEVNGSTAVVERDKQGGTEELEATLPAVISAAKGMAEQRIPNMRGIMAARSKPLQVVPPSVTETLTETVSYELPPAKGAVKLIDPENMEELVNLLHNEAKVI